MKLSFLLKMFYFIKKDKSAFFCFSLLIFLLLSSLLAPLFLPHSPQQIYEEF